MSLKWHLETRKVEDLREYDKNPRKLTKAGLAELTESVTKFGIAEPLAVTIDGEIIGGHGRKRVLQDLKVDSVDCYVPNRDLTLDEFRELNVRLNHAIAGGWDWDLLREMDRDFLKEVGFTAAENAELFRDMPDPGSTAGAGGGSTGNFTVQYNIVFDNTDQQEAWFKFVRYLKRQYPDAETLGARIQAHVEESGYAEG